MIGRLGLFVAIVILLTSCQAEKAAPPEVIRTVRTQRVSLSEAVRSLTFAGTTSAGLESRLSFKVSGTLSQLEVKVGDQVAQGQLIARIDPVDYRLKVKEAQAALARAMAQYRNADAEYERVQALYARGNASRKDLDAARAASESAQAEVDTNHTRLSVARTNESYTRLKAPVRGAISEVPVEVNENVSPGQVIAVLLSGPLAEVNVVIPESLITEIRKGAPVTVAFDPIPGETFDAVVTEVGIATSQLGTTYPVTVRLVEKDPRLRPGMASEVTFRFVRAQPNMMVVPPVAVGEDRQGRFVFVAEPTGGSLAVVQRRKVTVGALSSEGLEILSGLGDGELVVVAGINHIVDGQKVKLQQVEGQP